MGKTLRVSPWPSWAEVYERWQSHAVPDVPIFPFDFRHQYPGAPWIWLRDGHQLLYTTNPMRATAYHLAVHLSGRSPEFIAAYKLNAWCIMNSCDFLQREVLAAYFKDQQDSAYDWWTENSRYLLPYVNEMRPNHWYYTNDCDVSQEWKNIVDLAAEKWGDVAAHLGILRIPDFMERDSTEHKDAEAFYHEQYEERERTEFERLSKKFSLHVQHLASLAEKPIAFVEGKLDAAYLIKATRLFRGEKDLSRIEIRQIGDEDSLGGIGGGKDALNRAHKFLAGNPHLIKRKVLLLYDFDANKDNSNHKNLFVRSMPRNEANDKIKKGIENLFPMELFETHFYTSRKKFGDYGEVTEIRSFEKERFCRYICDERSIGAKQERDDFANFEGVLSIIFKAILPNS